MINFINLDENNFEPCLFKVMNLSYVFRSNSILRLILDYLEF